MIEVIIFAAVFFVARQLRRAFRQPLQSIRIDIYHHFDSDDDGERIAEPELRGEVVPFERLKIVA